MALDFAIPDILYVGDTQTDGRRYSVLTCDLGKDCTKELSAAVTGHDFTVKHGIAYSGKRSLKFSDPNVNSKKEMKIHVFFDGSKSLPEWIHIDFYVGFALVKSAFVRVTEKETSPVRSEPSPSLYCHRKIVPIGQL